MEEGCLLRGSRVVVPPQGRKAVIDLLHDGHPGNTWMKGLASSFVWWPGIDHDLEERVKACDACQRTTAQEHLHPWEFPSAPQERLHVDFAGPLMNKMYLIVVDACLKLYHSPWQ